MATKTPTNWYMVSVPRSIPDEDIRNLVRGRELGDIFTFPLFVLDLKFGTLDDLMRTSDELSKFDGQVEATVKKAFKIRLEAEEAYREMRSNKAERRKVNKDDVLKIDDVDIYQYVMNVSWDNSRFMSKRVTDVVNKARTMVTAAGMYMYIIHNHM